MTLTLSRLVAQAESGNQPHATRYEPNFRRYVTQQSIDKLKRAYKPAFMNDSTAFMILQCSWGRHQIMGENLYALGYVGTIPQFQMDTNIQDSFFDAYCQWRGIAFTLDDILKDDAKRFVFARKYNGDGDTYGKRLLNIYAEMVK